MRPNKYPEVNEIVMVCPTKITDMGIYVNILEYKCEGLIILNDLVKYRIRSINKIVSLGKKFPASVLTVDKTTGNITHSKKCVNEVEADKCEKNFKDSKYIYDISVLFTKKMKSLYNTDLDNTLFYNTFVWPLSTEPNIILSAFRSASKDFSKIYNYLADIDDKWTNCFKDILSIKFKEKDIIVEAVMEIVCEEQDGVNIIKNALLRGLEMSNDECPFRMYVIKPPYYKITIKTNRPNHVIQPITHAIENIKSDLLLNGGRIRIIKSPEIVLEKEFEPEKSDSE